MKKGGGFHICLYLALPLVTPFIFSQGEIKGDFNIYLYSALPSSLHSSYGKVRKGGGVFSHMSLPGLALVTPLIFAQGEKGGFKHMSLPGLALVTSFIFSQCEIGDDFNICLYLALPLSLHSSYGKVRRGVGVKVCL